MLLNSSTTAMAAAVCNYGHGDISHNHNKQTHVRIGDCMILRYGLLPWSREACLEFSTSSPTPTLFVLKTFLFVVGNAHLEHWSVKCEKLQHLTTLQKRQTLCSSLLQLHLFLLFFPSLLFLSVPFCLILSCLLWYPLTRSSRVNLIY